MKMNHESRELTKIVRTWMQFECNSDEIGRENLIVFVCISAETPSDLVQ